MTGSFPPPQIPLGWGPPWPFDQAVQHPGRMLLLLGKLLVRASVNRRHRPEMTKEPS